MPRYPKLTPDLRNDILSLLVHGVPLDATSRLNGVQEATVRNWRARDRKFDDEVQRALAEGEALHVQRIAAAGKTNWRASAWLLERMYPERWGEPSEIEIPDAPPTADSLADL